jgi:GT2 family glycosyltransferase
MAYLDNGKNQMTMFNTKSFCCTILIATYNRLPLLQKVITSIEKGTKCSYEIIVIDGGSTDGTINYLKKNKKITLVFQGKLLGTARAYNNVWRKINSKYTTWLSDDTMVTGGSLDLAVDILEKHPEIGMVGLKMKDATGPWRSWPYKTSISKYGIVNCNHGVVRMDLLRAVGYFNEDYRSYTVDPDLTASILCTGKEVVMTKAVSILHYREWAKNLSRDEVKESVKRQMGGIDNKKIYHKKFKFLDIAYHNISAINKLIRRFLGNISGHIPERYLMKIGLNHYDIYNIQTGRFINLFDPVINMRKPYYLVQKIPHQLLDTPSNPYYHSQ